MKLSKINLENILRSGLSSHETRVATTQGLYLEQFQGEEKEKRGSCKMKEGR